MRKYLNYARVYAIVAIIGGIFYREFTKWNKFEGNIMLRKVHGHLFFLGMLVYILVALFNKNNVLEQ